jgi:hypothetical protein
LHGLPTAIFDLKASLASDGTLIMTDEADDLASLVAPASAAPLEGAVAGAPAADAGSPWARPGRQRGLRATRRRRPPWPARSARTSGNRQPRPGASPSPLAAPRVASAAHATRTTPTRPRPRSSRQRGRHT